MCPGGDHIGRVGSCVQVTQLSLMLDALLAAAESPSPEALECYFLEALCCSLGASLLDDGRKKFDEFIKTASCLSPVQDETTGAGPGEIPGWTNGRAFHILNKFQSKVQRPQSISTASNCFIYIIYNSLDSLQLVSGSLLIQI